MKVTSIVTTYLASLRLLPLPASLPSRYLHGAALALGSYELI